MVYDQGRNSLIVFREPAFMATEDCVFEVKDVKYRQELMDLETDIIASGSMIISQKPLIKDWTSISKE